MAQGPEAVSVLRGRSHCFLELHRLAASPAAEDGRAPLSAGVLLAHYTKVHADAALDGIAPAPIVRRGADGSRSRTAASPPASESPTAARHGDAPRRAPGAGGDDALSERAEAPVRSIGPATAAGGVPLTRTLTAAPPAAASRAAAAPTGAVAMAAHLSSDGAGGAALGAEQVAAAGGGRRPALTGSASLAEQVAAADARAAGRVVSPRGSSMGSASAGHRPARRGGRRAESLLAAPPLDMADAELAAAVGRLHSDTEHTCWLVLGYAPLRSPAGPTRAAAAPGAARLADAVGVSAAGDDEEAGADGVEGGVDREAACAGDEDEGGPAARPRSGRLVVLAEGTDARSAMRAPATSGHAHSALAGLRRAGWGPAYLYLRLATEEDAAADGRDAAASVGALRRQVSRATFVLVSHVPGSAPAAGGDEGAASDGVGGWTRFSPASQAVLRARLTLAAHRASVSAFLAHHVRVAGGGLGWARGGPKDWPYSRPERMLSQSSEWGRHGLSAVPAAEAEAAVRALRNPDRVTLAVELRCTGSEDGVQLRVRLPLGASVGDLRAVLARRCGDPADSTSVLLYRQLPFPAKAASGVSAAGASPGAGCSGSPDSSSSSSSAQRQVMAGPLSALVGVLSDDGVLLRQVLMDGEPVFAVQESLGGEAGASGATGGGTGGASAGGSAASGQSEGVAAPARRPNGSIDAVALLSAARAAHSRRVQQAMRPSAIRSAQSRREILARVLASAAAVARDRNAQRLGGAASQQGSSPPALPRGGTSRVGFAASQGSPGSVPRARTGAGLRTGPPAVMPTGGRPPPRPRRSTSVGVRSSAPAPQHRSPAPGRPRFRPRGPDSIGAASSQGAPRSGGGGLGGRDMRDELAQKAAALRQRRASAHRAGPGSEETGQKRGPRVGRVVESQAVAGTASSPGAPESNAEWMRAINEGGDAAGLAADAREELELRMAFREIALPELELGRVLGQGVTAVVRHARWWHSAEAGGGPGADETEGGPDADSPALGQHGRAARARAAARRAVEAEQEADGVVEVRPMTEVAVKEFTAAGPGLRPATQVKAFMRELAALRTVPESPNVVRVLGACTHPQLRLVLEYMPFGDLFGALRAAAPPVFDTAAASARPADEKARAGAAASADPTGKALSLSARLRLGLDVARGLAHLHACGRVHRDLKSHNVLLDIGASGLRAKVGDFGTARLVEEWRATTAWTQTGTLGYVAPEMLGGIDGVDGRGPAVDVFSLAVVLWELVAEDPVGGNPLKMLAPVKYCRELERGLRPGFLPGVPDEYAELTLRCWSFEPSARPTAGEVVAVLERLLSSVTERDTTDLA